MDVLAEQRQDVATLKLSGRFDFDAHRAFKRAYEPCLAAADVREIRVVAHAPAWHPSLRLAAVRPTG